MCGKQAEPGIAPRAVELLYRHPDLRGEKISLLCVEVRCDQQHQTSSGPSSSSVSSTSSNITDLLSGVPVKTTSSAPQHFASSMNNSSSGSTSASAASSSSTSSSRIIPVTSFSPDPVVHPETETEALDFIRKAFARRHTASTKTNPDGSSRSHALIQFRFLKSQGVLNLVDLAGCERYSGGGDGAGTCQSGGTNYSSTSSASSATIGINTSLSTLARCFRSVTRDTILPPVRDSTLTWILQDCFSSEAGKKSYISLILCIAPEAVNRAQTKCALQFAHHCSLGR
ncbi:unnamed protein product [Amoebophrya sp. A25]|nr:unnamed protein product [Amoebophrya sp. A25]|eukprot:GSA25T00022937001.1